MASEIKRKDKIKKNHNTYTHDIKIVYPIQNILNMKKEWRAELERMGEWLENSEENYKKVFEDSLVKLEEQNEAVAKELEDLKNTPEEDLVKKWKEYFEKMLNDKEEFITKLDERKVQLEEELKNEFAQVKANATHKIKEKRDALKFWDDAERGADLNGGDE
jgi:hypothetical protein